MWREKIVSTALIISFFFLRYFSILVVELSASVMLFEWIEVVLTVLNYPHLKPNLPVDQVIHTISAGHL